MRQIVSPKSFSKKLKNYLKQYPHLKTKLEGVLALLTKDTKAKSLKTHKLSGKIKYLSACSIDHSHRLVFHYDDEYIYLLNIGTHDEVY